MPYLRLLQSRVPGPGRDHVLNEDSFEKAPAAAGAFLLHKKAALP